MSLGDIETTPKTEKISVDSLLNKMRKNLRKPLVLLTDPGSLNNKFINDTNLHRPGLALSGYLSTFTHHRIQILGNTETQYLSYLPVEKQIESIRRICSLDIPLIFITNGNSIDNKVLAAFNEANIPVVSTQIETTRFMSTLGDFLSDLFALQAVVHGSMVDVYGIGLLITGESGIGKSEIALDLVERGHRLVSDDVVVLTRKNNVIMASSTEMNKHFMEIRGLGIVDVMSMFGIRAIRYQKRLETVISLMLWNDNNTDIDRTGLDQETINIIDIDIPLIRLPITPGKNITVITEVIALNHLLKNYGYDPAKAFQSKIKREIAKKAVSKGGMSRAVEYFEGDIE